MTRYRRMTIGLFCMAIGCYVFMATVRPMIAPDEFRYGEIPREMLESGDFLLPTLNGLLYFEKPPLGYWVTAGSISIFGENCLAVRLPFILATLGSALIVYRLMRRYGPGKWTALLAATIFLTCGEVAVLGSFAVLDPLLCFFLTAAMACFFVAGEAPPGWGRQKWLFLCGLACAGAFMTKGFLAFAVPVVVAGPYLLWSRRFKDIVLLPITPIVVTAIVSAPWALATHLADGDFWHYFFWIEHVKRFSGGGEAQHAQPVWFYLPVLLMGFLPWTVFLPQAWRLPRDAEYRPLVRYCLCWLVFPVLFFSAASGKLATYILPCFAPAAILLAMGLTNLPVTKLKLHLAKFARGFSVGLMIAAVAVFIVIFFNLLGEKSPFAEQEKWKGIAAGVGFMLASVIAWQATRTAKSTGRIGAITAAMFVVLATVALVFPAWHGYKTPQKFLALHEADIPADAIFMADSSLVHVVCWQFKRDDVYLAVDAGEMWYGLERDDQAHRMIKKGEVDQFIADPERKKPIVIFDRSERIEKQTTINPSDKITWRNIAIIYYQ